MLELLLLFLELIHELTPHHLLEIPFLFRKVQLYHNCSTFPLTFRTSISPLTISLAIELVHSSTCDYDMNLDLGLTLLKSSSKCETFGSGNVCYSLIDIILLNSSKIAKTLPNTTKISTKRTTSSNY